MTQRRWAVAGGAWHSRAGRCSWWRRWSTTLGGDPGARQIRPQAGGGREVNYVLCPRISGGWFVPIGSDTPGVGWGALELRAHPGFARALKPRVTDETNGSRRFGFPRGRPDLKRRFDPGRLAKRRPQRLDVLSPRGSGQGRGGAFGMRLDPTPGGPAGTKPWRRLSQGAPAPRHAQGAAQGASGLSSRLHGRSWIHRYRFDDRRGGGLQRSPDSRRPHCLDQGVL